MASSLFVLLDDIATVMDDIAVLSKVAAKKTAGVLGDDLALNAQQVSGIRADRELPVVWAVAKGSLLNKLILVPAALALSIWFPQLIIPILMLGGAYLCFEGFEKVVHSLLPHDANEQKEHQARLEKALLDPQVDFKALEKDTIKGAIRTDFILSAEIIVIALGTVAQQDTQTKATVLAAVALLMTIGVYGLVAAIVKLDDLGLYLHRQGGWLKNLGSGLLVFAPWLMKALTVAGTIAMFLVGGGIIAEGIPFIHHTIEHLSQEYPGFLGSLYSNGLKLLTGLSVGAILVALFTLIKKIKSSGQKNDLSS